MTIKSKQGFHVICSSPILSTINQMLHVIVKKNLQAYTRVRILLARENIKHREQNRIDLKNYLELLREAKQLKQPKEETCESLGKMVKKQTRINSSAFH